MWPNRFRIWGRPAINQWLIIHTVFSALWANHHGILFTQTFLHASCLFFCCYQFLIDSNLPFSYFFQVWLNSSRALSKLFLVQLQSSKFPPHLPSTFFGKTRMELMVPVSMTSAWTVWWLKGKKNCILSTVTIGTLTWGSVQGKSRKNICRKNQCQFLNLWHLMLMTGDSPTAYWWGYSCLDLNLKEFHSKRQP